MRKLLCLAGAMALACPLPVLAAPPPVVSASVGVCDFNAPSHCAAPNSDGSVNVKVTGGTGGTVTANQGTAGVAAWPVSLASLPATVSVNFGTPDASTLRVSSAPACTGVIPINQTASTDLKTFTGKGYICSVLLITATSQSVSLVEGTGSTCGTGTAALIGGTSASLAVNGNAGFSAISGTPWLVTQTTADHLCLLQSTSSNISGTITYRDAP